MAKKNDHAGIAWLTQQASEKYMYKGREDCVSYCKVCYYRNEM